ncbi:MAG: ubiquitin-like protein [Candidatus Hermodarchaeota archaeon]
MRKKNRLISLITLYFIVIIIYIAFFIFRIENSTLFLTLNVGSVTVLSTSTLYTVIQAKDIPFDKLKKKKILPKPKAIQQNKEDILEDYYNAMPLIEKYVEAEESYEDIPIINKFIFSVFNQEDLDKINQLDLSKTEKIQFIQEMLYFDTNERKVLIEDMLKNRYKTDKEIIYTPPVNTIEMKDQIRVYVRSLVEPGEKTKIVIVDTSDIVNNVKNKIGVLFNYEQDVFHLSSGGILLNPESHIDDYDIDDDDEIALIPSRTKKE